MMERAISADGIAGRLRHDWDRWLLGALLLAFNLPLFLGYDTDRFAFYPGLLRQGRWWLLFTGQFAHITWYHFLLDGLPFLLVYCTLTERNSFRRFVYFFVAGIGSVAAATLFSTDIAQYGLRGFSGITYGIMAVSSLELALARGNGRANRTIGLSLFVLLLGLIAFELITGRFPFEFLLFHMAGRPILICHAGGVIGALCAYLVFRMRTEFPAGRIRRERLEV